MNFDFSDEQKALQQQARRVVDALGGAAAVRRVMDGTESHATDLWREMGRLRWLSAAIPERYGGEGLGYVTLCAIAEELGRGLAPVPSTTSIYLAAEALLLDGTEAQKQHWLPQIGDGRCVAALALIEGLGAIRESAVSARAENGRITGAKLVPDGSSAHLFVVAARDENDRVGLWLVEPEPTSTRREPLDSIDPSRPWARVTFRSAAAEPLAGALSGWRVVEQVLQRAAILTSFEQLGGAERCLEIARDYALQREAFGRVIGQYQAVKHRLADTYVQNQLARSNAYYGAWALDAAPDEIPVAAAVARIAATDAFERAARDCTQTLGGIAATWAHDAHLYYRRSRHLAALLGNGAQWRDALITHVSGA